MRKLATAAILLAMGSTAFQAHALDLAGSDTLEDLTILLINSGSCGSGLNYVDGGSGVGETALINNTQQVAPMSRKVNTTASGTCNATGEGMFFAMDAISIVVDSEETEQCGSVNHIHGHRSSATFSADGHVPVVNTTPSAAPSGTLSDLGSDWATKLLRLYAGNDGSGSASACNSAERNALAGNYKSLFPNSCGGGVGQANQCSAIKHVFRRGDASGTSDLFKTLVGTAAGLPGGAITGFCNGTDQQDKDPIRRACTNDEQVCDTDGKLGLLLPIITPEVGTQADLYNNQKCSDGKFKYLPDPFNDATGCCVRRPDGTCAVKSVFLKCITPVTSGNLPCLNGNQSDGSGFPNLPVGAKIDGKDPDPRVYNLQARDNNTTGNVRGFRNGTTDATAAYYRIHSTTGGIEHASTASSSDVCRVLNNTEEIGCLVQAPNSTCSIGYAGYASVDGPSHAWAEPLALGSIDINTTNVQNFATGGSPVYPLSRKLYLNTFKGFENVTGAELDLAKCFANISNAQLATSGFFPVPSLPGNVGTAPVCETMCANTSAVDGGHCGGNLAPFN